MSKQTKKVLEAVWRAMAFSVCLLSASMWHEKGHWGFAVLLAAYAVGIMWGAIREVERYGLYWRAPTEAAQQGTQVSGSTGAAKDGDAK